MELELSNANITEREIEAPRDILPPLNNRTNTTASESNCAIASQCATVSGAALGTAIGAATSIFFNNANNVLAFAGVGGVLGGLCASGATSANARSRTTQAERVRQRRVQRERNEQMASPDR
jgi:hypothetical protein